MSVAGKTTILHRQSLCDKALGLHAVNRTLGFITVTKHLGYAVLFLASKAPSLQVTAFAIRHHPQGTQGVGTLWKGLGAFWQSILGSPCVAFLVWLSLCGFPYVALLVWLSWFGGKPDPGVV